MAHDELLDDFRHEALENLQQAEEHLLALESGDERAIDVVFRAMHSIKGNSSFFDLVAINTLAHQMESMLDAIRSLALVPDAAVCDLLLQGCDRLRRYLDDLGRAHDPDSTVFPLLRSMADLVDEPEDPRRISAIHVVADPAEPDAEPVAMALAASVPLPHLGTYLVDQGHLTTEQVLQALIAQAESEPRGIDLLSVLPEIDQRSCIAIADHATRTGVSVFAAAADLGLLPRRRVLELRQEIRRRRRPLAKVIVDLDFADAGTVAAWLRAFIQTGAAGQDRP